MPVANAKPLRRLRLVVPVYNDWDSFAILLRELDRVAANLPIQLSVSAIDDGSTIPPAPDFCDPASLTTLESVEIIHLATNLGHQRAIAVGLCVAVEDADSEAILIMDGDGEDSPDAIAQLLNEAGQDVDFCVVARRGKRSENLTFKLSVLLYKLLFKLLTGRQIAFGNFSLLSRSYARRLVSVPDLWNNLPVAILRSRLPIKAVQIDRAPRYAGQSKMNFTSLVVHGLSGISVFAEVIFVRLLFLTGALFLLSCVSIPFVLSLRLFFPPKYATPGWATTVSFGILILLVQTLSFTLSFVLMLLNSRVQRLILPIADYKYYIDHREILLAQVPNEA
jgi:glycosyltransferase involved in cell wall biosynthesis